MAKVKWGKGVFSKELAGIKLEDALGMTIECEDGIPRRVVEIVSSVRWPWKAIINEQDENSNAGHFVNMLSLCAQILGKPVPSIEVQKAFERVMRVRFNIAEDGKFESPPTFR